MKSNVVQSLFPRPIAEQVIRDLYAKGAYVAEPAFLEKMRIRDFSMRQVMDTLAGGSIVQGPRLDDYGDWRCKLKRRVAGRLVRVVLAIHDQRLLYLISVH